MKFKILAVSVCLMSSAALYGQSRYKVPFAFQVGGQSFAAGHYRISVESLTRDVLITPESGTAIMAHLQYPIQADAPAPAGKLVFNCYGKACFLTQVWRSGDRLGMKLFESKRERELATANTPRESAVLQSAQR